MNISSLISFFLGFGVLAFGLISATNNPMVFADGVSAFLVLGGTFTATAVSFRLEKLWALLLVFFRRVLTGKDTGYGIVIENLINVNEVFHSNPEKAKEIAANSGDHFLMEAVELAADGFLQRNELVKILRSRVESMFNRHVIDANKFKTIGKFPPAFGMMGTTIGMVVLLSNLGGADAMKTIGPSMAICLLTTLYGVVVANLVIVPIAENLTVNSKEIKLKRTIVAEGIRIILEGKNSIVLAEELNSFLLPSERVDWQEVLN